MCYRKRNPLPEHEYTERHHIIPRCLGGCDADWNVVDLLPEEHYQCHKLLVDIYPCGSEHFKMLCAWNITHHTHDRKAISAQEYGKLKRTFASREFPPEVIERMRNACKNRPPMSEETKKKISESLKNLPADVRARINASHKGHPAWNKGLSGYLSADARDRISRSGKGRKHTEEEKDLIRQASLGRHHTEEARRKISAARKGNVPWLTGRKVSEETRKKISDARKGMHMSEETKNKMRIANLGKHLSEETKRKIGDASRRMHRRKREERAKIDIEAIKQDSNTGQGLAFV